MVKTYCSNIIDAYTSGSRVLEIFTYGELVWPTGPMDTCYIKWANPQSILSGYTFTMEGQTYSFDDYDGYFDGFHCIITKSAFVNCLLGSITTNALYISSNAFVGAYIPSANLYRCISIGYGAFWNCSYLDRVFLPSCEYIADYAFGTNKSPGYGANTLKSVSLPLCSYIGNYAFSGCRYLSSVYAPVCTFIGSDAFYGCSRLTSIRLPACESIGYGAFRSCSTLTYAEFPACTTIGSFPFNSCSALEVLSLPALRSMNETVFTGCSSLKVVNLKSLMSFGDGTGNGDFGQNPLIESVDLAACSYLGPDACSFCSKLTYINLPSCEYVGSYAFDHCSSLPSINLPVCSYVGSNAFNYCSSLTYVNLPVCSYIGSRAFQCNPSLTIILGSNSVCTGNNNMFKQELIIGFYGSILVPSSLVNDYKTAQYWSSYSSWIFPIPE